MTVKIFRDADIFEVEAEALSHGCNTQGATGGLAGAVFSRYPEMKKSYHYRCERGLVFPGEAFIYETGLSDSFSYIYNLFTQIMPGANADMELIRLSLEFMLEHMKENDVKSVNIPQIGCGIGGLKWEEVQPLLEKIFGPEEDLVLQIVLRK